MWGVFLERGRTSLDSDPTCQFLRHTFIHNNICWRIEGGTFFCFHVTLCVWAVGETVLLEEPTRAALVIFIPAKVAAQVSFVSMQISPWGKRFLTTACFLSFPLPFFLSPPRLSSPRPLRLSPPPGPVLDSFGFFIWKVGGRDT